MRQNKVGYFETVFYAPKVRSNFNCPAAVLALLRQGAIISATTGATAMAKVTGAILSPVRSGMAAVARQVEQVYGLHLAV